MITAQIPYMGAMVTVELLPIRAATSSRPALMMYADSAYQFVQMDQAAKAAGVRLNVNTAFRDHAYQQQLWDEYQAYKAAGLPHAVVARPGTSDHERGFSVDIETGVPENLRTASKAAKAASSPVYAWMHANAGRYGFENDVSSEPWHWTCKPAAVKVLDAAGAVVTNGGGTAVAALLCLGFGRGLVSGGK